MITLVPRIQVNQVVLAAAGKLSTGTITPTGDKIPNGVQAADIVNTVGWNFTDRASGVTFPVAANEVRHFPGSFVKDMVLDAGTYKVCIYRQN